MILRCHPCIWHPALQIPRPKLEMRQCDVICDMRLSIRTVKQTVFELLNANHCVDRPWTNGRVQLF